MDLVITKWRDEREYDRIIAQINERILHGFVKHEGTSNKVYEDIMEGLSVAIVIFHNKGDNNSVKTLAIQLAHVYHLFNDRNSIIPTFEVIYE